MNRNTNHNRKNATTTKFEPLESRKLMSAGALDTSFSLDGKATVEFGNGVQVTARDVAVQPDGKTLIVGQGRTGSGSSFKSFFAVSRLNADGAPDTTFGTTQSHRARSGNVLTQLANDNFSVATSVAIQPDGRIVVAGYANNRCVFAVARYLQNGTLDSTFDGDGKLTIPFHLLGQKDSVANDVVIQNDGKIVVAGYDMNGGDTDFAVVRLNPNGSPDTSFDGDGKKTIGLGGA